MQTVENIQICDYCKREVEPEVSENDQKWFVARARGLLFEHAAGSGDEVLNVRLDFLSSTYLSSLGE